MIFVDTSFFFALAAKRDAGHERAHRALDHLRRTRPHVPLLTTNHVVFECITLTRRTRGHHRAVEMGEQLYQESIATIHWARPEEEQAAFNYLTRYADKRYSAVDCLSFVIMKNLGIREALALDSDFAHNFIAIPGPTSDQ